LYSEQDYLTRYTLCEANKLPRFYEAQNNVNRVSAHVRAQDELSMELKLLKVH